MANHRPHSHISKIVGDYLRLSRERAGLSLAEAGTLIPSADAETLSRFEQGIADPPMSEFVKILQYYEVSLHEVRQFIGKLESNAGI